MLEEFTPPASLAADGCAEVAVVDRNGLVESRHLGAAAVLDADGRVLRAVGDIDATIFPRSTLKPLQALALLETGARFRDEELVLATASHSGSPRHTAVVERMLADDGRDEAALQCPVDWPLSAAERAALRERGEAPSRLTMNCSGKHAGFLRAADALVASSTEPDSARAADPAHYLDPAHPLQQRIRSTIETWTGEPVRFTGVDGCGAPLHATSLRGLAQSIARIAAGTTPMAARLMRAIAAQPWAIDGDGRANTVVIERLGGIAKIGAEGLVVIGTSGGIAVAVKILDGSMRATTPVALHLLAQAGALSASATQEALDALQVPVRGGTAVVGGLRVTL
jgi:L-asparaginase II